MGGNYSVPKRKLALEKKRAPSQLCLHAALPAAPGLMETWLRQPWPDWALPCIYNGARYVAAEPERPPTSVFVRIPLGL